MRCQRIRKHLPLYIGRDLSPKREEAVRIHLDSCLDCRRECEGYVRSVKTAKEWLNENKPVWGEGEWKRTVRNTIAEKSKFFPEFAPWPFKKGWAFAAMAAVMIVFIFFATRPLYIGVEDIPGQAVLSKSLPQNVVSMTMVSKDTGLKVVWILNKNFNLEEDE